MADIRFKILLLSILMGIPILLYSQNSGYYPKCALGAKNNYIIQFSMDGTQQVNRPDKQYRYLTKDERLDIPFLIHYDLTGSNAIPSDNNLSGEVPDWIIYTERALAKSWHKLTDSLGFQHPPVDQTKQYPEDPPGGAIDLYFIDQTVYGYTQPDNLIQREGESDIYASFLRVDNDFSESGFYKNGLEALQVTVAHELFHVFHFGYRGELIDIWWYELSSSWFEDEAYPVVNDYVQYSERFFNNPLPLDAGGAFAGYRVAHYGHVISDYDNPTLLEKIWAKFSKKNGVKDVRAYEAIDDQLRNVGSSFLDSYLKFAGWNFSTGQNAINGFGYPDASIYPDLSIDFNHELILPDSLPFKESINAREIKYIKFKRGENLENHFELVNLGNSQVGTSSGLFGNLRNYSSAKPNEQYSVSFNNGSEGIIALVNASEDTSSITIQRVNVLRPFPNPYVLSELSSPLNLFAILGNESQLNMQVYDLLGRRMYQSNLGGTVFPGGKNTIPIQVENSPLAEVSSGVYFIRLQGENYNETAKITILR